jgi:hypothetical protein
LVCNEDRKKEKKKEKILRVESACVVQDVSNIREVPNNQVCVNFICVSLKQFLLRLDHDIAAFSPSLSLSLSRKKTLKTLMLLCRRKTLKALMILC